MNALHDREWIELKQCLEAELAELLRSAVAQKPEAHIFRENYTPCRPMVAIGG